MNRCFSKYLVATIATAVICQLCCLEASARRHNTDSWETEGYRVLSLIRSDIPNPDGIMNEYLERFPESPLIPQILFNRAVACFDRGEYPQAAELFAALSEKELYKEQRDEFYFRKGYCYMRQGENAKAGQCFSRISEKKESPYLFPALYYSGYINYASRDFAGAIPFFEKAKSDERYRLYSEYHILESKFLLKEYDEVVKTGPALYENVDASYRPNVARIISEAYFGLDMPDKARHANAM